MIDKRSWNEFRETGLLWFINTILHLFGWVIVVEIEDEKIVKSYPARTSFRGFDEGSNTEGYKKITRYLADNINDLMKDVKQETSNDTRR